MATPLTGTHYSNDSFQLHGIVNGVAMGSALTLRCLTDINHELGISHVGPNSGAPYREKLFPGERRPELTTAVAAIKSLLDQVSMLGTNCITSDGTHPGVLAFMQSHNSCAANARTAGSGHQRLTVAKAHLLVTGLGGQKGQTVHANVRVINLSADGNTGPDTVVYNAALPSQFVSDEEFVIGPVTVGNFTLDPNHVLGWQYEAGIQANVIMPAGGIYATYVDIEKVLPKLTITHTDASLMDAAKIPEAGLDCTHANTYFYLKRRNGDGLDLNATTVHVKGTIAGRAYHSKRYSASGSGVATGEVTVESIEGVGGVPATFTTGVAIT